MTMTNEVSGGPGEPAAADDPFRVTFEQAPIGLAHVAQDGSCLRVNPRFCTLVGATPAVCGHPLQDVIHPADRPALRAYLARLLHRETAPHPLEVRGLRSDGATTWLALTGSRIRAAAGVPPSAIICVSEVTPRKEVELLLAAATAFLANDLDYETTLTHLVDAVVPQLADWCCVVITDPAGALRRLRVAHVDPAKLDLLHELERRYPLDPAAPDGEPYVLRSGRPELHSQVSERLLRAAARDADHLALLRRLGMVSSLIVPLIARGRTVGALTFVAADSGRQYTPADVITAQDLASRAAVAADNARLHQQAQEAVRIRDDFLLAASHDLRTPLTSIKGYVQVIQMRLYSRKPLPRDWLARQAQQLDDAVTRLAAAVEAMTDVAQLHIGHALTLAVEPVEIGSLVRSVAPGVAMAYNHGATPVEVDVACEVVAMGDRVRLERVLQNIIGNAINYSPLGAAVQVRVEQSGNWAAIEVQDRGVGIPAAELAHLFRRFYRASTSRGMKGTGIGLAGSKAIIEQHGGQISIASTLGSGTTVTIQLPLAGTYGAQELPAHLTTAVMPP